MSAPPSQLPPVAARADPPARPRPGVARPVAAGTIVGALFGAAVVMAIGFVADVTRAATPRTTSGAGARSVASTVPDSPSTTVAVVTSSDSAAAPQAPATTGAAVPQSLVPVPTRRRLSLLAVNGEPAPFEQLARLGGSSLRGRLSDLGFPSAWPLPDAPPPDHRATLIALEERLSLFNDVYSTHRSTTVVTAADPAAVEAEFTAKVREQFDVAPDTERGSTFGDAAVVVRFRFNGDADDIVRLTVLPLVENDRTVGSVLTLSVDQTRPETNDIWMTFSAFGWTNEVPGRLELRLSAVGLTYGALGDLLTVTTDAVFERDGGVAGLERRWAEAGNWTGAAHPADGARRQGYGWSLLIRRGALAGSAQAVDSASPGAPGTITASLQGSSLLAP